ncbi:eukaryotic translation initiation factor 3 subunit I [Arthroderma uncinatum]|uniref:eukaryotic translation initiation factor 3 subunit I n=1 Tax=Arthroderma uncinatum TaxID=74035 RepID=UPI00144AD2BE|nr:eukaryotic translation initiation factor 3 subunit I [Arthroderma uncinatum]KAF3492228.1 eukaryotic translation initiation factor 3 subunit I [Arthroderma uncinatum]
MWTAKSDVEELHQSSLSSPGPVAPPAANDLPIHPAHVEVIQVSRYYPPGVSKIIGRGGESYIGLIDESTVLKYPCIPGNREGIEIEAELLAILGNHPRILSLKGLNEHGLLLQYAPNGNVYDRVLSEPVIPLDQKLCWCKQAAEAVKYIHEKGVIHCDINLRNLLLDDNLDILLADFQVFPELDSLDDDEQIASRFQSGQFPTDSHAYFKITDKCWRQLYESAEDIILDISRERALTQIKFSRDGDLLFSCAKDKHICVWYYANGERLGTYSGHQGALWTVDVSPNTVLIASGAADNSVKLWNIKTGECVKTWDFPTAVKRVEFSADGSKLLAVTEKRMGYLGTIVVLDVAYGDGEGNGLQEQAEEPSLKITCEESKATVAGWSYLGKYIIAGHEDGSISQYDAKTGEQLENVQAHELDCKITDLQFSADRTYFITACSDKSAKILSSSTLEILKTYPADTPLNTAAITAKKDFVVLGGGQAAMDVTTTSARQGKFEARFYHKIFEDEIGRVRGHFGPLNTIAVHPAGVGYASGGEDGYVRVHHFDKSYNDFMYEVEREQLRK